MHRFLMLLIVAGPVLLASTLTGSKPVCAHSDGDCADHVVEVCNNQYPSNYDARVACVSAGLTACEGHTHGSGGGGGVDPASEDFAIEENESTNSDPSVPIIRVTPRVTPGTR